MRKKRVKKKEADQADYKIMTKPVDSITLESNLKSCHAVAAKFVQNWTFLLPSFSRSLQSLWVNLIQKPSEFNWLLGALPKPSRVELRDLDRLADPKKIIIMFHEIIIIIIIITIRMSPDFNESSARKNWHWTGKCSFGSRHRKFLSGHNIFVRDYLISSLWTNRLSIKVCRRLCSYATLFGCKVSKSRARKS